MPALGPLFLPSLRWRPLSLLRRLDIHVAFVGTTNNPFSVGTIAQLRQLGARVSNLWRDSLDILIIGDTAGAFPGAVAVELKNYSGAFDATDLAAVMKRAAEKVKSGVKVVLLVTNWAPGAWKDGGQNVEFFTTPTGSKTLCDNYFMIKTWASEGVVPALLVKKNATADFFFVELLFSQLFGNKQVLEAARLVVLVVPTLDMGLARVGGRPEFAEVEAE
jgi:hypothetical protein